MDDLISRQAAIDALGERPMVWVESDYELGARNQYDADVLALETVPSAQPEITPEAAIEYLQTIGWMQEHDRVLSEYAQPMRKRGKWKMLPSGNALCSECGYMQVHAWDAESWDNYCHHCGAKMEGWDEN